MFGKRELPSFKQLPIVNGAPPHSAWHLWGEDDQVGSLNLLTDERTAQASREVRTGEVFNLNLPVGEPWRPEGSPMSSPIHFVRRVGMAEAALDGEDESSDPSSVMGFVQGRSDYLAPYWLQASSQWNGLAHVRHPQYGNYNGILDHEINNLPGGKLGIDQWAKRCVVGRGVLLDVARYCALAGRPLEEGSSYAITVDDLQDVIEFENVTIEVGDILLIRTGWTDKYVGGSSEGRRAVYNSNGFCTPGLSTDDSMLEFLWDLHPAALAADNPSVEQIPASLGRDWRLHSVLIPLWGMIMGEFWNLQDLAAACCQDGRYSFFLVSVPLNVRGGVCSPSNAVAIR